MTIAQVIKQLEELPEEEKTLQLYACDDEGTNSCIESISVYDSEAKHGKTNPLGINYNI